MSKRLHQKGFTLIELLVVIAIIGILAAVVVVSVGNSRQRARTSAFESAMTNLQTSVARYCDENSSLAAITGTSESVSAAFPASGSIQGVTDPSVGVTPTITANCSAGTFSIAYSGVDAAHGGTHTSATVTQNAITY